MASAPSPAAPPATDYQRAPIPPDDAERLAALWRTGLHDSTPAAALQRVVQSVAQLLQVPMALVSLVDEHRQWFLARCGLDATETPRDVSFCGHVVAQRSALAVGDARLDARFAGNPLVTGAPHIRAYLGEPIRDEAGHVLGTLCALDCEPRAFTDAQREILRRYARAVEQLIRRASTSA
jgi:GAF domain-containing protein